MDIWARENLHIWQIASFDFVKRTSDERAQLLRKLGLRQYAYFAGVDAFDMKPGINTSQLDVDAEISAMKRSDINVCGWFFWFNADDPADDPRVVATFEAFERHQVHPPIWLPQSLSPAATRTVADPPAANDSPAEAESQRQRVQREADRIAAWVKLAAAYGCTISLYNHQGWYGMMHNQLAILERLRELGITDVGLVYNFSHSMSRDHDDAEGFAELWRRIQPHVVAINVTIITSRELEMLRVIHQSGWHGLVGILTGFGNADLVIPNQLWIIEWAVSRIRQHRAASRS